MSYDIRISEAAQRNSAVVRSTIEWPQLAGTITRSLEQVYEFLEGASVEQSGHNIVVYLDGTPTVEVGVEVSDSFEETPPVLPSSTPAGPVATTVHRGHYTGLPKAHAAIRKWCADQGREPAGPTWEVYGDFTEDPADFETRVFHLLA